MFVGHALLAFALVAGGLAAAGRDRGHAVRLGVVAAAFATAPDVDMAYALVGVWHTLAGALAATPAASGAVEQFWSTGNLVHRAVTHSLLIAPVVALAAALWVRGRRVREWPRARHGADRHSARPDRRGLPGRAVVQQGRHGLASVALVGGLIAVATVTSGALGGFVMALFGVAALAIAEVVARRSDLAPRAVGGAALVGAVSHPFGDLFTGHPPAFLYPLDVTLVAGRPQLFADPTLNLLGAFGVELGAIWLGVGTALWLSGVSPRVALDRRATLGAGYAAGAVLIPAPTLEVSYQFVFTVIAVGLVGVMPRVRLESPPGGSRVALPDGASAAVTGLAAVTLAGVAYAVAYVAL